MMQKKFVLCKGMIVEVTSSEEGFNNAWYTATVVDTPKRKGNNKVLIEYHNLVTDDGSKPLTELASPSFVRPLPPSGFTDSSNNNSPRFKEEDVVDAFYHDGWWTGVVCRVLEDEKFFVYFHDPPDVIPFELSNLRMHHNWIKGKWVPSKRRSKQLSAKSVFSTGQAVEVNLDDETFRDMWFTAIFIIEFQGSFLVKYRSPSGGDEFGFIKVMADSLHVRPIPPPCVNRNYELLDKVEVVHEFGWRIGEIKEVIDDRTYVVFFEISKESEQLDHSSIRPHMRWIDGKWISKSEGAKYQHEEVNSKNKKRGRLSNSDIMSPEAGNSCKKAVKKGRTCNTKEHKMATAGSSSTRGDENVPLRMLLTGVRSHVKSNKQRLPSGKKADPHAETPQVKSPQEIFSINDTRNNELHMNTSLPFVKRSPVWKTVDSMRVFERMLQKPHFLPLNDCEEDYREAIALGMMFTFSCVSDMVAELKYDDPRDSFSSILNNLLDLENHGFDVNGLRVHVHKVLGMKDRISQLQEEARVAETRFTELTNDFKKKSDEAEEIKKEMTVLQGRLVQVEAQVEKTSHDMSSIQSSLETIYASITNTLLEFHRLAGPEDEVAFL